MQKKNDGFASCLRNLYEDTSLCDVSIVVDSDIVPPETVSVRAHRIVLATMSEYFHAMFYGHFKEVNRQEVRLFGVSHSAFQHCLRFMYNGFDDTLEGMSLDEGLQFYSLARMLLLDTKVQESFSEWVAQNVTKWEKHLWKMFTMAIELDLPLVVCRCEELFSDVANEFLVYDTFLTVPTPVVQKVLACDQMNCTKMELELAMQNWFSSNKIDDHVKQDMLKTVQSRKDPFFKGQKVNFYHNETQPVRVNPDTSEPSSSAHCYSTNMYFHECIMLAGVTVVLKRNMESRQITKGSMNLKLEIKKNAERENSLMTRVAVVTFDLTESTSQELNIFFPAIKCCVNINYLFTFCWNDENAQPPLIHMYGELINALSKADSSHIVGMIYCCALGTGADQCDSCQTRRRTSNVNEGRLYSSYEFRDDVSSGSSYRNDSEHLSENSIRSELDNEFDERVSSFSYQDESQDDVVSDSSYRNESEYLSENSFNTESDEFEESVFSQNEYQDDLSSGSSYRNDSEYLSENSVRAETDEFEETVDNYSFQDDLSHELNDVIENMHNESLADFDDVGNEDLYRDELDIAVLVDEENLYNESLDDINDMDNVSYYDDDYEQYYENPFQDDLYDDSWNQEYF